jgi:hypothetical protein
MKTVTTAQAASILGASTGTITRLYRTGLLKGHKLTSARNSPLRIYQDSLDQMLLMRQPENLTTESPSRSN